MGRDYLGHLSHRDPLYGYLKHEIQPQLGGYLERADYRVFHLNGSNAVYLYEETHSGTRIIGKFFLSNRENDRAVAAKRLAREYDNLAMMRNLGFSGGGPHYIARPLGRNDSLNELLVVEYCSGELFSQILTRAIRNRDDAVLFSKLTALAYFLASFHNRTASPERVHFHEACSYMDGLVSRLRKAGCIDDGTRDELFWLRDRWKERKKMESDCQVVVHGDATPENFMFGDGLSVISFDLERIRRADRVFDIGRLVGELQHFFLLETGNKYLAERFIGHFLWEYSCHFPDRDRAFRAITRRVPFYMGVTLLRIARNPWLSWEHRLRLVHEAKLCLRGLHL